MDYINIPEFCLETKYEHGDMVLYKNNGKVEIYVCNISQIYSEVFFPIIFGIPHIEIDCISHEVPSKSKFWKLRSTVYSTNK